MVTDHFAAGFEKVLASGNAFEMAFMYAPEETTRGIEVVGPPNPGHTIEVNLESFELTAGWKIQFREFKQLAF